MEDGEPAGTEPLPPGRQGLILAYGRQIMKGYYKRDDLLLEKFITLAGKNMPENNINVN